MKPTSVVPLRPAPDLGIPLLVSLGLLSAAVTAQQLALMQILGWMHWHHFAYMIVAVALLGYGIAGTVLSLARDRLARSWRTLFPALSIAAAISIPAGVGLAQAGAFAVDLPLVFHDPRNVWRLVMLCLLLLPPFFCGGLATGLALTIHARQAGRAYAATLLGAGAGGLIGLALISSLEPPRLPGATAFLAIAATLVLWRELGRALRVAAAAATVLLGAFAWSPGGFQASQFKPLSHALALPDARIVSSQPGLHGWIQIVTAPSLRPAPAVGFQFQGEVPVQPAVFVNGIEAGSLPDANAVADPGWLDHTTDAAAFATGNPRRVLLLENGPGGWSALAAQQGAERIVVVESNTAMLRMLTTGNPPAAIEWKLPPVQTVASGGRAFLRRTTEQFDVIRFPTVGALGGSSGLGSAAEQPLLTREAFIDAWRRLAPGGVISVTVWMDFPERNPLRLLATLAEALESEGAAPPTHLAAVRGWATVTFLARRDPWTAPELAALRDFASRRGFDPLILPDLKAGERENYHHWQNAGFFPLVDQLVAGPREPLYRDYEFHLRPPHDSRPYFSQFLRWSRQTRLGETFGLRSVPFFELGSLVVGLTFLVLGTLAIACIVLPLFRSGWQQPGKTPVLLYFSGLGAGFMLVEIGLILRAQSWLGSPVLAASIVITTLLIASGLGSMWSERLALGPRIRRGSIAIILLAILAAAILFVTLDAAVRGWPAAGQIILLAGIIFLIGFPLGCAFPIGLRHLEARGRGYLAWAWAINGSVSVATPAGAMLLALTVGFDALLAAGMAAYAFALAATLWPRGTAPASDR